MLTSAQKVAFAADVALDGALAALPHSSDSAFIIAAAYNAAASPDFYVWRTEVPIDTVYDSITWANLTPADAPDTTQQWLNRAMQCQGKQFNIQTILMGKTVFNAAKATQRNGLKDALQNVPAGASGALLDAGWAALKDAIYRKATRLEKLFATGTGTTGSPATMAAEGIIDFNEVKEAMGW